VILHAHGQKYIYQVQTIQAEMNVSEIETAFKHEEFSWLTLITCRGYDEKSNSYRWRTVVRAILMSTVMEP
jgi:sortase (surface protein transpeptidase)